MTVEMQEDDIADNDEEVTQSKHNLDKTDYWDDSTFTTSFMQDHNYTFQLSEVLKTLHSSSLHNSNSKQEQCSPPINSYKKNIQDGPIHKNTQKGPIHKNTQDGLIHKNKQDGLIHKNTQDGLIQKNTQDGLIHKNTQDGLIHKNTQDGPFKTSPSLSGRQSDKTHEVKLLKDQSMSQDKVSVYQENGKTCVKLHRCTLCGKVFINSSILKNHVKYVCIYRPYSAEKQETSKPKQKSSFRNSRKSDNHVKKKYKDVEHSLVKNNEKAGEDGQVTACTKEDNRKMGTSKPKLSSKVKEQKVMLKKDRCYKCSFCGKTFKNNFFLVHHVRTHTGERPYKCDHCDKAYIAKSSLKIHKYAVHPETCPKAAEKLYCCEHCGKIFKMASKLKRHLRLHTGEKPVKCDQCNKAFTEKSGLNYHIKAVHTGIKPVQCPHCEKKFVRKFDCKTHIRTHTGEKPYACTYCGKAFRFKISLNAHEKTHTGELPYTCTHCYKAFTSLHVCKQHIKTHTAEKDYLCNICGRAFARADHLVMHVKTHTRECRFSCAECGKGFIRKDDLAVHVRKHTGERPYGCDLCGKAYIDRSALRYHIKTHMRDCQ